MINDPVTSCYHSQRTIIAYYDQNDIIKLPPLSENTPLLGVTAVEICGDRTQGTHKLRAHYDYMINRHSNIIRMCRLIVYVTVYICYLSMGAFVFQLTEIEQEVGVRENLLKRRQQFLAKYSNVKDDDLEDFLNEIIRANERGISVLRNSSTDLNWSFGQALFFSGTVVTTIGYGHVTPLSQYGKIFCMIYAAIGIPLTLVLLAAVVERLMVPTNWLLGTLNSRLGHLYQPFNIRLMHLAIIATIVIGLFFVIPTFVFAHFEPTWNLLDAFYYCFISLTTIGLGDYIPGDLPNTSIDTINRSIYKIGTTIYLIIGLIGMMLVLTIFREIPQLNLGQLFTETAANDSEKMRLSGGSGSNGGINGNGGPPVCYSGPAGLYIPQRDEETRRAVVRIRPRADDSPSPDNDNATMMRVP